ncbi:transposase [Rhizobium sp. Root1203]|uniref:transposase n=1 Tax=Rhizobium sp. Root1203 TaxID=1736427 RepID=UPI001FCD8433
MEPGASVSAIAHRLGIHPSQLFSWRRDAQDGQRRWARDPAIKVDRGSVGTIEVVVGDVVIRASGDFDEAHLQRVIRAVRSA